MTIQEIYSKFGIPPNLQEHMFRVAAVAQLICDHWVGEPIDKNEVVKIALLHDLGNVVKFDFEKHPEFLGDEVKNVEYWKKVQVDVIAEYGADDHKATEKMLTELGIPQNIIDIIQAKSFGNSVETANASSWPLKILFYSDLRVMPNGICTLEERLQDVLDRMEKYRNRPDIDELMNACRDLEKQIQKNLNVDISNIEQGISVDSEKYQLLQI